MRKESRAAGPPPSQPGKAGRAVRSTTPEEAEDAGPARREKRVIERTRDHITDIARQADTIACVSDASAGRPSSSQCRARAALVAGRRCRVIGTRSVCTNFTRLKKNVLISYCCLSSSLSRSRPDVPAALGVRVSTMVLSCDGL